MYSHMFCHVCGGPHPVAADCIVHVNYSSCQLPDLGETSWTSIECIHAGTLPGLRAFIPPHHPGAVLEFDGVGSRRDEQDKGDEERGWKTRCRDDSTSTSVRVLDLPACDHFEDDVT